jgi:hypothetical protein
MDRWAGLYDPRHISPVPASDSVLGETPRGPPRRRHHMAEHKDDTEARPPLMQTVFDNVFLLLVIGIVVPVVFYTIWGLLEIASIPVAR